MRGYLEEMLWYVVIILAVLAIFVFFMYQRGTSGIEVRKSIQSRLLDEESTVSLISTFTDKLPFVGRTAMQTAIDAILQGTSSGKPMNRAFYGAFLGTVNVSEVITPLFDHYMGDMWSLEVITPNGKHIYGHELKNDEILYVYESVIPVPEELSGYVKLRIGKGS